MSKITKIVLVIFVLALFFITADRLFSSEDDWICQDGQWVKHGNPTESMPIESCR